jgi:hypothetical protein
VAPASNERVDRVLENYLLALAGVDQCAVSAPDDMKSRLAGNLERAERAFADATADGLADLSGDMEAELQALAVANERSRAGLHGGVPIADLLADLERGTEHARRILSSVLNRQGMR